MASQKKQPAPIKGDTKDDFASVAKRLECDEDKERFEAKLGKLAKAKPMSNEHKVVWEKLDKGSK